MCNTRAFTWTIAVAALMSSCEREAREFQPDPVALAARSRYRVTVAWNGGRQVAHVTNWYEQNADALSRGNHLYSDFNCVGCHAHGGGGIAPAFLDPKWRYGSDPAEIYGSIMYG